MGCSSPKTKLTDIGLKKSCFGERYVLIRSATAKDEAWVVNNDFHTQAPLDLMTAHIAMPEPLHNRTPRGVYTLAQTY
jgi:hypothetical protein